MDRDKYDEELFRCGEAVFDLDFLKNYCDELRGRSMSGCSFQTIVSERKNLDMVIDG